MNQDQETPQHATSSVNGGASVYARTTLSDPLHHLVRDAVMKSYNHEFNVGKSADPFLIEAIVSNVAEAIYAAEERESNTPRKRAYEALDTERDYQDAGFGNAANADTGRGPGRPMGRGDCLLTLQHLLNEAQALWYRPQTQEPVAHIMRKIGGVAVQYMERYGTYDRPFSPMQMEILKAREATKGTAEQVLDALLGGRGRT